MAMHGAAMFAKAPEIHPQTFPLGSACNLAGDPEWCQASLRLHFNLAVLAGVRMSDFHSHVTEHLI